MFYLTFSFFYSESINDMKLSCIVFVLPTLKKIVFSSFQIASIFSSSHYSARRKIHPQLSTTVDRERHIR